MSLTSFCKYYPIIRKRPAPLLRTFPIIRKPTVSFTAWKTWKTWKTWNSWRTLFVWPFV